MTNSDLDSRARAWHADAAAPERLTPAVLRAVDRRHAPRRSWLALAGAAVAIGAALIAPALRPAPALAAVRAAMETVRTARWRHATETRDPNTGALLQTHRGSTQIDLIALQARVETEPDEVYVRTRNGAWLTRRGRTTPDTRPVTEQELRADLQRRLFARDRLGAEASAWERRSEGGLDHFVRRSDPGAPTTIDGGAAFEEFWADARTHRLVRTRAVVRQRRDGRLVEDTFLTDGYVYDTPVAAYNGPQRR